MEAKDTVIMEILATHGYTIEEAESILNNAGKAIYLAGIREVVEWLKEENDKNPQVLDGSFLIAKLNPKRWQAKLKEWGL